MYRRNDFDRYTTPDPGPATELSRFEKAHHFSDRQLQSISRSLDR